MVEMDSTVTYLTIAMSLLVDTPLGNLNMCTAVGVEQRIVYLLYASADKRITNHHVFHKHRATNTSPIPYQCNIGETASFTTTFRVRQGIRAA